MFLKTVIKNTKSFLFVFAGRIRKKILSKFQKDRKIDLLLYLGWYYHLGYTQPRSIDKDDLYEYGCIVNEITNLEIL